MKRHSFVRTHALGLPVAGGVSGRSLTDGIVAGKGRDGLRLTAEPLISVIIPNYNYGKFLSEAIDSVLTQTYSNMEVFVVDDGSTDASAAVLRRYQGRVRLLTQSNRGVSSARNAGIKASAGELIAFLDSDDVWRPEKLARQVELFAKPDVGMVYSGLRYIDTDGSPIKTTTSGIRGRVLKDMALLTEPGVKASGSSAVVRRICFETVGLFDEALSTSADWDMWRRIACRYEIDIVREPLVLYRQHDRAMNRNLELFERDFLYAFNSMFTDPEASEVYALRRRCYGNLYLNLADNFWYAGDRAKCLKYLVLGLKSWPPAIASVLARLFRSGARVAFGLRRSAEV